MKKVKFFVLICMSIMFLVQGVAVHAGNLEEASRVLFISSYSYAWDMVQFQIEGMKKAFGDAVVLDYEFMDTKRVSDETTERLFYEGIKYRLEHVAPYDVIIVGDDAALLFAMKYREELFSEIPIIFEGVNDKELAGKAAEEPLITGIVEQLSVEKNIDLGLLFFPEATKVVVIVDDSITGQAERENFYRYADQYSQLEFTEINASKLTTGNLKHELRSLNDKSILIYVVMTEDASGKQYTNREAIRLIAENAGVPALRMIEGGIEEGLLGGNIVSMSTAGELAANMALEIMAGSNPDEMEVSEDNSNVYCLNEQVMKKYDMDLSLVPEGTIIVNHQPSFIEQHYEAFIPGIILFLVILLITFWVCFDNIRRRKLLKELECARDIMESASQHDFLTGLSNRSKFMADLEMIISMRRPCTIMMIDIDDFKLINDVYGHTAGDDALKQVAARLKEMQSQILTPYRFAGDEFIVILESSQNMIVEKAAYQCRQIFTKDFILNGQKKKVCGSIGLASYPKDTEDMQQLIVCADAAMYRVKKSGKNDFAFYST